MTESPFDPDKYLANKKAPEAAFDPDAYLAGKPPLPPATPDQEQMASVMSRFAQGFRDPIDAGAQMIPRFLGTAASAVGLDKAADYLRGDTKFLGMDFGAAAVDKTISDRETDYQQSRAATGLTPENWDVARGAGTILPLAIAARYLPGATANTIPRLAGAGFVAGGVGGGLTPVSNPEDQKNFGLEKLGQTALGATVGTVLGPVAGKTIQGLTALYGAAKPYAIAALDTITGKGAERVAQATTKASEVIASAMREIGQDAENISPQQFALLQKQVADSLVAGKNLDPAALLRKADFEASNTPYLLGQITRDPSQFAKEQNLRGTSFGPPIMQVLNEQTRLAQAQLGGLAKQGGIDTLQTGQRIQKILEKIDDDSQAKVTAQYNLAKESTGKDLEVPLGGLASDAARIIKNFGDVIPAPIIDRIKSYGMLGEKQKEIFTFVEANDLLKLINSRTAGNPAAAAGLREMRDAVKRAMLDTPAPDVYAPARALAADRFASHRSIPALADAADRSLNPDKLVQKYIVSAPTAESAKLAELLKKADPAGFDSAAAELGAVIKRAAFGPDPASDAALKPAALANALRSLGPQKLEAWFGAEQTDNLFRLARVGGFSSSIPGRAAVSTSNSNPFSMVSNYSEMIPGGEKIKFLSGLVQPIINQRSVREAVRAEVPSIGGGESKATTLAKILANQASGAEAANLLSNPRRSVKR